MERDLPQPPPPPRDATQRLLVLVFNSLRMPLYVLWGLSGLGMLLETFAFSTTMGLVLAHIFLALTTLICLRGVLAGVVLARATWRVGPKTLAAVARRTSRPRRLGQWHVWQSAWHAAYVAAGVLLVPWQPITSWAAIPPTLIAYFVALPLVVLIARAPLFMHQVSERRRRASAA